MQCPKCGKQIADIETFCKYCDTTITEKREGFYEPVRKNFNNANNKPKYFLMILLCIINAIVLGVGTFFIVKNCIGKEEGSIIKSGEFAEFDKEDNESDISNLYAEDDELAHSELSCTSFSSDELTDSGLSEDKLVNNESGNDSNNDNTDISEEIENSEPIKEEKNNLFSASSTLSNYGNLTYYPENAFDGDITTAWVEGISGNGIGECLSISFAEPVNIQAFGFDNGYLKSEDLYYKNSRPKVLNFILETESGTENTSFYFDDKYDRDFLFCYEDSFKQVKKINIYIEDIYPGTKYTDTCITDIFFYDESMQKVNLQ